MNLGVKILLIWAGILIILRLLFLFPHAELNPLGIINASLQTLLCVIACKIALESSGRHKFVYVNFATLFAFGAILLFSSFIGYSILPEHIYANLYFRIYVNKFFRDYLWLFVVVYLAMDYFYYSWKTLTKYLASISITTCIVLPLFFIFLANPFQLYHEKEYVALNVLQQYTAKFNKDHNRAPSESELMQSLIDSKEFGDKNKFGLALKTVRNLKPYQKEGGITPIFWKPLDRNSIITNIVAMMFITLMMLYSYKGKRTYGAYSDKIAIILFLIAGLEILHVYSYIHSYSMEGYLNIFKYAQYVTIPVMLLMVYAFDLRLKFVLSTVGKYYENSLDKNPEKVTRWRDEIDNLILKTFSKTNSYQSVIGITESKPINKELQH